MPIWQRASIFIAGAIDNYPVNVTIACYNERGTLRTSVKWTTPIMGELKFYIKGTSLYAFFNRTKDSPSYVFMFSSSEIIQESSGNANIIDDTYTEVKPA